MNPTLIHSTTGLIHTLAAMCALLTGLVIFARPKPTSLHRSLGYVYSISMVVMIGTAFFIYHLTRSFNVLHLLAIVSCPPLVLGFSSAFTRRRGWLARHYHWMCYSYIGLCAAFFAEVATRIIMPLLVEHFAIRSSFWFWATVGVCSYAIFHIGGRLVERNEKLVAKLQGDENGAPSP